MKRLSVFSLVIVLVALARVAYGAPVIVTPPLGASGGDFKLVCGVVNAGTSAAMVTIELVDQFGVPHESVTIDAPAGHIRATPFSAANPGVRYCRVTGLSPKAARVTLCVVDTAGNCVAAVRQ